MENKYTRDQIKDAIWQELQESDYAGENNDRAYEIIGIVMAGIDKIVVSDVQPSAVWVKASEFKYEEGASYHAKDSESKGAGRFNKDGAFIWGNGTITWPENRDDLLILDESATAAGREDNAVTFAEWTSANFVGFYVGRELHHWYCPTLNGQEGKHTTTELYELFKQNRNNENS